MRFPFAFAVVLFAGCAAGFALPASLASKLQDDAGAQPPAAMMAMATTPAPSTGTGNGVAFRRESDGHFYADVSVDGLPTRMLVDTGATVIALTGDDARELGLDWDETTVSAVAVGANGPIYGVQTVLPVVAVGDFEATDVPALIIPEGLGVSLLGQSFLSKVGSIDISGDTMTLGEAS